jgi:hypothetical protein
MQRLLLNLTITATLFTAASLRADDMDLLSGKWSVKKVSDEGQNYTQTIEIKKDNYIFQILGANDRLLLYSEGDLKLEKLGSFNAARFFHVRAGNSASNLDDVDDEYVCVYALDGDTWSFNASFISSRRASIWAFSVISC